MATVQCPTEIPASHDHELLESKRHVPYVRCDGMGSHIYFKTDAAREWLAAHLVNDGSRAIENPSPEKEDDFLAGELRSNPDADNRVGGTEMGRCFNCNWILQVGNTPCPECGVEIDWET